MFLPGDVGLPRGWQPGGTFLRSSSQGLDLGLLLLSCCLLIIFVFDFVHFVALGLHVDLAGAGAIEQLPAAVGTHATCRRDGPCSSVAVLNLILPSTRTQRALAVAQLVRRADALS